MRGARTSTTSLPGHCQARRSGLHARQDRSGILGGAGPPLQRERAATWMMFFALPPRRRPTLKVVWDGVNLGSLSSSRQLALQGRKLLDEPRARTGQAREDDARKP